MSQLFNYFSDEDKEVFARRNLKPGKVLYLPIRFTNPPKEKFLVLLCESSPLLFFVVNSKIAQFILATPDLLRCQVQLSAAEAEHDFLDHDSYINCAEVISSVSEAEVVGHILKDVSVIRGEISATAKQQIVQVVAEARMIKKKDKKRILAALQGQDDS